MSDDLYRNSLATAAARLAEQRSLFPMLSPLRRALLDEDERAELDALVRRVDTTSSRDLRELAEHEAALTALQQKLTWADETTRERLSARGALGPPRSFPSTSRLDVHLLVAQWMVKFDGAATAWGDGGAIGDFELQGVRLQVALDGIVGGIRGRLRTPVAMALGPVRVERHPHFYFLVRLIRGKRAVTVSDPLFEKTFAISGDEFTARALLAARIRKELLAVAPGFPSTAIILEGGVVELRWEVLPWGGGLPQAWERKPDVRIEKLVPKTHLDLAIAIARALDEPREPGSGDGAGPSCS